MSAVKRWAPGAVLAAAGLVLMLAGYGAGGADVVFSKAVNICLECIGIG